MNAIQFIQQNGVEKAREVVEGAPETATHFTEALGGHYSKEGVLKMKPQWLWFNSINKEWYYDFAAKEHIHLPDLKRLVESVELIEKLGGIESAKSYVPDQYKSDRLKQAIADYESIYTNDIKIEVSFGVSLMSPERVACIDLTSVSPTSDTIDDSDLEYHVSKNCKVIDYDN